ncbi:MAG: alpha/beta hydrolase [Pseudonocardiales bacterium]|nr:MAG: alpha/beta hydrolase [Pseudonocardiales bacterium]
MFDGFVTEQVDVGEVQLLVRHGGAGPAVLLLHGHPRTSATWHRVAPRLVAEGFTVVCPDLRGYGASSKPATTPDHAPYSKRAMAQDVATLMQLLRHDTFSVVGHDRGSYVTFRLAMDHPQRVHRAAFLDSVPLIEALERCDARFAEQWWHWFFFAQPDKPERAILADPDAWYGGDPKAMGEHAYDEYRRAIHDPATVHAMLEDYRAGLGIDREHASQDRVHGRRLTCPVLVLWSSDDDMEDLYGNPLAVWSAWADDLDGHAIASGHHVAEDNPEALSRDLAAFLRLARP